MIRYKAFALSETGAHFNLGVFWAKDDLDAIDKAETKYHEASPKPYVSLAAVWDLDPRFYTAKKIEDLDV